MHQVCENITPRGPEGPHFVGVTWNVELGLSGGQGLRRLLAESQALDTTHKTWTIWSMGDVTPNETETGALRWAPWETNEQ